VSRGLGLFTPLRTGSKLWPILVAILLVAVVLAVVLGSLLAPADEQAGTGDTVQSGGTAGSGAAGTPNGASGESGEEGAPAGVAVTLVEVVDGDTIWVRMPDGSQEKVRYIGLDAPELPHEDAPGEYLGRDAASHNEALLASGPLRLETDVEPRDEFGRLLAYVWAGDVFVNERMVLDGYAWAHDYPPNLTRQDRLWAAQDRAREMGAGLWQ
jgi:micrococcal nuclease